MWFRGLTIFRSAWLAPPIKATGPINKLVNSSVTQNDVLFASDGLQLVSIDRLYSLKCALSSYSKTRSPLRLEDAVDDLRRCVLANGRRQVSRSDLLRSYDWMSVSDLAVIDLDYMYRRAYGGVYGISGIAGMPEPSTDDTPEPMIRSSEDTESSTSYASSIEEDALTIAYNARRAQIKTTPSPKLPVLKIQTSFDIVPNPLSPADADEDDKDEYELQTHTARPSAIVPMQPWNIGTSIDQILSTGENLTVGLPPEDAGPLTPNVCEENISPITRGEWGFLMGNHETQSAKKAPVEIR